MTDVTALSKKFLYPHTQQFIEFSFFERKIINFNGMRLLKSVCEYEYVPYPKSHHRAQNLILINITSNV